MLDDLLDEVLDDFEIEPEILKPAVKTKSIQDEKLSEDDMDRLASDMEKYCQLINQQDKPTAEPEEGSKLNVEDSFQDKISKTMNKLKDSDTLVDNQVKLSPNDGLESLLSSMGAGGEEEVMAKMMKELEGLMETGDFENMFSGMMEQLVSRDLLYEPLKDLSLKYPVWLESNTSSISKKDSTRYNLQKSIIDEILGYFDATPEGQDLNADDKQKVTALMQKMQDCGNPPEEIMKELQPGLEMLGGSGETATGGLPDDAIPPECAQS